MSANYKSPPRIKEDQADNIINNITNASHI